MDRRAWQAKVHRVARVGHDLATNQPPPHNSFSEYNNTYLKLFILVHSDRMGILFQSEIHSVNFMAIQAMWPIYTAF